MSSQLTFRISVPTQDSFLGRECNNPECKRYFKIHIDHFKDEMFCPYCGVLFDKEQLWTQEQLDYAKKHVIEEGTAYVVNELDKIFKHAFKKNSSNRSGFSVTYKSNGPYKKKHISSPSERDTDTELECVTCHSKFQIIGLFGYCPCCHEDNIIVYDTNIKILLDEIKSSSNQEKSLRHAYNDLVSTFENYCKNKNTTGKRHNFQNLDIAKNFFMNNYRKELFNGITPGELETIKRFFQKRHVYQHNKGYIDQKYIEIIPSDSPLLGSKAVLTLEEFNKSTALIRKILLNLF